MSGGVPATVRGNAEAAGAVRKFRGLPNLQFLGGCSFRCARSQSTTLFAAWLGGYRARRRLADGDANAQGGPTNPVKSLTQNDHVAAIVERGFQFAMRGWQALLCVMLSPLVTIGFLCDCCLGAA